MKNDIIDTYTSEIVITDYLLHLLERISNEAKDKSKKYIFISTSCFCLLPITETRQAIFSQSAS